MYKEYLAEFWYSAKALKNSKDFFSIPTGGIFREVGVNTFRNAIGKRFQQKELSKRVSFLLVEVANGTDYPVFRGQQDGSSKAPTGSKTSHSKRRKKSKLAMDSNPSQTLVFTHVDNGMHKEDQQATGDPTSLGVTSEARANPQLNSDMLAFNLNEPIYSTSFIIHYESALGNDASAAFTAEADPEILLLMILYFNNMHNKLKDLAKMVSHVQASFKDLDSHKDDAVIVVNDSDEDKDDEVHATENVETEDTSNKAEAKAALFKAQPSFSNVEQLKSLKTEFSNILSAHDFSSSLPTKLMDLSSKLNDLTEEVKGLKNQVHNLEIKLPRELKEIPSNLEGEHIKKDKGKNALSSEVAVKESTESDSDDDETHLSGSMVESSRIKKVKKFDFVTEDGKHIHLIEEQINQQKKIEEESKGEAAKRESEVRKEELIDLPVQRAVSKNTNCDVLTIKGLITLKVYIEDGTSEIILNFKASDLHLGEWREVMKACPNRIGKGWETIYKQIGMILFNSYQRHNFVTIEDFRDFSNTMLYTVQEFFFGIHQARGLDDHARTFSSLLLAEIDKRNLNPLKQMRVIEHPSDTKTKEGPWLELQFSLVDNSKLNVVYLTSRRFTRREKDCFMSKEIKQSLWGMLLLKLVYKYINFPLRTAPSTIKHVYINW
nr:hypothetical protein [Tanacetum cinerariifolium]